MNRIVPVNTTKAETLPSTNCSNNNDSFTVDVRTGNGKLVYPVAMITADEANMAGAVYATYSSSTEPKYYMFGSIFYTMSPCHSYTVFNAGGTWSGSGGSVSLYFSVVSSSLGIRPSISLAPGARVSEGDGTVYDPFVIDLNSFKN